MKNKFTILTASFNSGKYLEDWADSILSQKYRPLEVVMVEDQSTDYSLEIINKKIPEFKSRGIDFKLIKPESKLFCGSSYNLALKHATGNYLGVLDSDDMLESFACEFIAKIYDKHHDIAWIYTQYNKYNRKMDRVLKRGFCRCPGKKESILSLESQRVNVYGHWRTFSDRITNKKNLFGKGLKCSVDKHLGLRLEEIGPGMFVDKTCYKYRTRSKGEKSIVHNHDHRKYRRIVCDEALKRRKGKKVYSIIKY